MFGFSSFVGGWPFLEVSRIFRVEAKVENKLRGSDDVFQSWRAFFNVYRWFDVVSLIIMLKLERRDTTKCNQYENTISSRSANFNWIGFCSNGLESHQVTQCALLIGWRSSQQSISDGHVFLGRDWPISDQGRIWSQAKQIPSKTVGWRSRFKTFLFLFRDQGPSK